jgi:hypothetical protein
MRSQVDVAAAVEAGEGAAYTEIRSSRAHADVAQLVEHHLAKVGVAGSNPVVRSECGPAGVGGFA